MALRNKIQAVFVCICIQCLIAYIRHKFLEYQCRPMYKQLDLSYRIKEYPQFVYPEERERFDWEAILGPCKSDMQWQYRRTGRQEVQKRTSAKETVVFHNEINPPGYYSKFLVQSMTNDRKVKTVGGDYWRAYLTGSAWQRGFVRDLNDGTYEIWFLIKEPGNYTLNMLLEHSLCDGLRDPPLGWFERGNIHGRFQEDGILGYLDDFLVDTVALLNFSVRSNLTSETNMKVPKHFSTTDGNEQIFCHLLQSHIHKPCFYADAFKRNCQFVWDGYGRWENQNFGMKWLPNFPIKSPVEYSHNAKLETLWFLGDSLTYRFWDSSYTRVLCRTVFKNCKYTYTWVYKIDSGEGRKEPINVGLKFNQTRFFEPLHSILNRTSMKSNRSVVVINFGLHLVMSLNFSQYKNVIEEFVGIVEQYRSKQKNDTIPQFIWKTTTLSHKENTKIWNLTHARFLTNQRVTLFNAFANSRLCTAGITIFDVFPISASFPSGTRDHVHYHSFVFEPAEDALADFVWREYN